MTMRAKAIWFLFFGRLNYTLLNRYLVDIYPA